jgi:hypothetical protein
VIALDLVGSRIGRLTVLERAPNAGRRTTWRCRCDCGTEKVINTQILRRASTRSCGCYAAELREARAASLVRHGESHTRLHNTWLGMKGRCYNPKHPKYPRYGARGITVCQRWMAYENFAMDMQEPPVGKFSIGRIDNDGPYSPENCRWETPKQQARNQHTTKLSEAAVARIRAIRGLSGSQMAVAFGVSKTTINRVRKGLTWTA